MARKKNKKRKWEFYLGIISSLIFFFLMTILLWLMVYYPSHRFSGPRDSVMVNISQGQSAYQIANQLEKERVIPNAFIWLSYVRFLGADKKLRHGNILFHRGANAKEVLRQVAEGYGIIRVRVMVPEGSTRFDIAKKLEEKGICKAADFLKETVNQERLDELKIKGESAEGFLFPDTYEFYQNRSGKTVLRTMVRQFWRQVNQIKNKDEKLKEIQKDLDWTIEDVVNLASIVEKEAVLANERKRIAGVFMNRLLSKNFKPQGRLQADPTVSYGCENEAFRIPSCDGKTSIITKKMLLDSQNRYNTYRHSGLPPTPISNPGIDSIKAVLNYEKHNFFYFVVDGPKKHRFSQDLKTHLNAVKQYRQKDL